MSLSTEMRTVLTTLKTPADAAGMSESEFYLHELLMESSGTASSAIADMVVFCTAQGLTLALAQINAQIAYAAAIAAGGGGGATIPTVFTDPGSPAQGEQWIFRTPEVPAVPNTIWTGAAPEGFTELFTKDTGALQVNFDAEMARLIPPSNLAVTLISSDGSYAPVPPGTHDVDVSFLNLGPGTDVIFANLNPGIAGAAGVQARTANVTVSSLSEGNVFSLTDPVNGTTDFVFRPIVHTRAASPLLEVNFTGDGRTFTIVDPVNGSTTFTWKLIPSGPNEIQEGGNEFDLYNAINAHPNFAGGTVVIAELHAQYIQLVAGTAYPGAAGNTGFSFSGNSTSPSSGVLANGGENQVAVGNNEVESRNNLVAAINGHGPFGGGTILSATPVSPDNLYVTAGTDYPGTAGNTGFSFSTTGGSFSPASGAFAGGGDEIVAEPTTQQMIIDALNAFILAQFVTLQSTTVYTSDNPTAGIGSTSIVIGGYGNSVPAVPEVDVLKIYMAGATRVISTT